MVASHSVCFFLRVRPVVLTVTQSWQGVGWGLGGGLVHWEALRLSTLSEINDTHFVPRPCVTVPQLRRRPPSSNSSSAQQGSRGGGGPKK